MSKARQQLMIAVTACVPLLTASCGDPVNPRATPGILVEVSGNAQSTLPGGQVPRPLVVRALDAAGNPRAGVLVRWSGSTGSTFVSDTSRTSADGIASAVWVLGNAQATYTAKVEADSSAELAFAAEADPDAVEITPVPDTLRFHALDDTASIKIRVRSASMQLDTLIDPRGWGSPANPVATPVYTGTGRMVLKSLRNGVSHQSVNFGTVATPFTAIVKQVPVDARIVRLGNDQPAPDTLVIVPDSALSLGVVAVDSRGRTVEDSSAIAGITWHTSDSSVATVATGLVSAIGVVRGIADGVSTITARVDAREMRATVRVWTLRATAVAAGGGSTCALLEDDRLACWGFREVGNNSALNVALAPELRNGSPFITLSMSEEGACGLTASGAVRCWGKNSLGQLGTGSTGPYVASPVALSGDIAFTSIAAGPARSCGLTAGGRVYCWGAGFDGALGDGTYGAMSCGTLSCTPAPTEVSGARTFIQLTVGAGHACAITSDERAYCWGSNRYGQLGSPQVRCAGYPGGDPATSNNWCSTVPVEVDGGRRFKALSAGITHTCGITTDDALFCWGSNLGAVIGVATIPEGGNTVNPQPLAVAPDLRFSSVYSGRGHTCAIDTENAAWCWGQAFIGQLGTGATAASQCVNGACERTPVRVAGALAFKAIVLGVAHTCGVTMDDVAYCWGWGGSGALGTGATSNQLTPVRVAFQRR